MRSFILSAVSGLIACAAAMAVALAATIAWMLAFWLVTGAVPDVPEFSAGFLFATVFWPIDRRLSAWLRTAPPATSNYNPIEHEEN